MGVKEPTASQLELFDACKRGETEKVRGWLTSKRNRRPRTPLNFLRPSTPGSGWISALKDANSKYTPLHLAALHGHAEICRLLVDADAHVTTARDRRGNIPLHLSAWSGHTEITKLLTDFEPESVDSLNNSGDSPLHLASQLGHVKVVGILLDKHSDARLRNASCETPLDIAARCGHASVCKILVSYCPELALQAAAECASPVKTTFPGQKPKIVYPLHAAARGSHVLCMQMLRLAGFDVDYVTEEGSALHVAALHGQVDAVRYLIQEGVNPYVRDSLGRSVVEALEEHQNDRSSDLTQVMPVKEERLQCRLLIEEYISSGAWGKGTLDSSSDSGIDRRECMERGRRSTNGSGEEQIWRPLPSTAAENVQVYRSRKGRIPMENESFASTMSLSTTIDYGGSLRGRPSLHATNISITDSGLSSPSPNRLNRTWNSRLLTDAITAEGKIVPRFPLTSPHTKSRHQNSKRVSDTLPTKTSVSRTCTAPVRGSILPGDGCVYRAPPQYDSWQPPPSILERFRSAAGYDNAPTTAARRWEHKCASPSDAIPPVSTTLRGVPPNPSIGRRSDGTQTLPTASNRLSNRARPSVLSTFRDIDEEPHTSQRRSTTREESLGLGSSPMLTTRGSSRSSNMTFNCSTLERSLSPAVAMHTVDGRAPLAIPEELTASTTNSIISHGLSPERQLHHSRHGTLESRETSRKRFPVVEESSSSSHRTAFEQNDLPFTDDPPSPNTSESRIFDIFCAAGGFTPTRETGEGGNESPSGIVYSDSTVASSCSLPLISQISLTPPNVASPTETDRSLGVQLRSMNNNLKKLQSDELLNENEEWMKIDCLMKSFGPGINRESMVSKEGPQVACLQDRHSKALTLQLSGTPRSAILSSESSSITTQRQTEAIGRWLRQEVGLGDVDSSSLALLFQRNGFDRVEHMKSSLDRLALLEMGVNEPLQGIICNYLETSPSPVNPPSAKNSNFVSDWLTSLDLKEYMGNFIKAGLKSMLIVHADALDQSKLNDLGIYKLGHVLRILYSLRKARKEVQMEKASRREKMNSPVSTRRLSVEEQLITGWVPFSAHYLGSTEISNVNSTEEARAAMAKLKKAIREIAKVPQVRLEVSMSGVRISDAVSGRQSAFHEICHIQIVCQDQRDLNCFTYITSDNERYLCHVFCVLTADVATEIVLTLGQAFECAAAQMHAGEGMKEEEEKRQTERTFEC